MQTLQTLIRNLAVILILASFLELLLPNKSMRSFVQMIMGLFVISAVLNPITSLLNVPLSMDVPAWSTSPQELPALASDKEGVQAGKNAVQEQFRQIVRNQVKALVAGVSGVQEAEVEIKFEDNEGGLVDQPKISLVKVILRSEKGYVKPIEPVIIGEEKSSNVSNISPRTEEVRERISVFMNLPKEKIIVQES